MLEALQRSVDQDPEAADRVSEQRQGDGSDSQPGPTSGTVVRVGVVTWNSGAHLAACLDALPGALGRYWDRTEVVVVDNASSDDSASIAAAAGARVMHFAVNAGYARAMNEALDDPTAQFLIALNPDTRARPGSLEALVDRLATDVKLAVVAPRLEHPGGRLQHSAHRFPSVLGACIAGFVPLRFRRGRLGERRLLERFSDERHHRFGPVDWTIGAVHAMRSSAVGSRPYSERYFMYVEDLELCHRVRQAGFGVALDGTVVVEHVGNASGAVAFGARREARWLDAMYDWYARTNGTARARAWALANTVGLSLKLIVLRILSIAGSSSADESKAQSRRRLARYHLGKLIGGPTMRESTVRSPEAGAPRRILGVVAGGMHSGAERVLLRDLVGARQHGWDVRVACGDGPLVAALDEHGIERLAIPDLRLPRLPRPLAVMVAALHAARAGLRLRRVARDAEILVINSVNALSVLFATRSRTPVVYFAHDVLVRLDRRILLRIVARRIDMAIAVSDWVARRLRVLGVPTEVIYNGTEFPVAPAKPADPPCLGISALLTPWKGHEVLLDALAQLDHADVVLEIMGGAPDKDEAYVVQLRHQVEALDLGARVRFLGHQADPLAVMRRWTIAISASTDPEAGPLVGLEAMSLGLPVIATDHGGVTEVLGAAGRLVPPGDAGAMARAIDAMLDDADARAAHAKAGPEIIAARGFTLEAQRLQWLSVLDSVARSIPAS